MNMAILVILIVLVALYGIAGLIMAFYEQSQTDDEFKPMTILTWLPKMLGMKV